MKLRIFFLFLGFLACAQKMLPPSPDRFPPRLAEIEVLNRTKLNLKFNEEISAQSVTKDNFLIYSTQNETLSVKEVMISRRGDIITLVTEKQNPIHYLIQAQVSDLAGNRAKLRSRFLGSVKKDTIPPRIVEITPKLGSTKQKKITIRLRFSEEIDTLRPLNWAILPKSLKNRFEQSWQSDYRNLDLTLPDSLGPDTIVYFTLLPTIFDFEGNRLTGPGFTFFTSDSTLNTKLVTGKIQYQNRPITQGLVIFAQVYDSLRALALTVVDSIGSFALQVREGIYEVTAVADTNYDNRVDLSGRIKEFNTTAQELLIEVHPDTVTFDLDWYLR
uniref:SbsA Ig-like domain-containing protein n=1 Tax=candidate division WOR-3 bacterium TaxID=2052148 RepID=A0A7C6EA54_UNCW3